MFVILRRTGLHSIVFIAAGVKQKEKKMFRFLVLAFFFCFIFISVRVKYFLFRRNYRDEPGSLVTVAMLDLPKQRYVRRNVKTILDYVSTYL